jgi:hypothetical protein
LRRVYYRRRRVLVFVAAGNSNARSLSPLDTLHRTVRSAAAEAYPEAYRDLKEPADGVMIIVPVAEPAITLAGIL